MQERELHLERMLVAMRRGRVRHDVIGGEQRGGEVLVDRHLPERRLEGAARVDAHAVEGDAVRRPDQHHGEVAPPAQPCVGVGGHRPGVAESGMGADQPDEASRHLGRRHGGEVAIELGGERRRITGIPAPRHRRPTDSPTHVPRCRGEDTPSSGVQGSAVPGARRRHRRWRPGEWARRARRRAQRGGARGGFQGGRERPSRMPRESPPEINDKRRNPSPGRCCRATRSRGRSAPRAPPPA